MIWRPNCLRCKSNVNVVEDGPYHWRCCFCGRRWPKNGQFTLNKFLEEK